MRLIDADEFSKKFNAKIYIKLMKDYLNSTADDNIKKVADFVTTDILIVFNSLIDNVQTVEGEILTKEAYSDLCLRASKERPQGEWEESHIFSCGKILRMQLDVIEHKCRNCGRWSIEWVRSIPDNFCPNCGAEMKEAKKNETN